MRGEKSGREERMDESKHREQGDHKQIEREQWKIDRKRETEKGERKG